MSSSDTIAELIIKITRSAQITTMISLCSTLADMAHLASVGTPMEDTCKKLSQSVKEAAGDHQKESCGIILENTGKIVIAAQAVDLVDTPEKIKEAFLNKDKPASGKAMSFTDLISTMKAASKRFKDAKE